MIAVLDYGAGNIRSVENALARLETEAILTKEPARILAADGVILPGVGAFADAMGALKKSGLIPVIHEIAASGKPLLGICLGMQALFDSSEEGEGVAGLGLVPGTVCRLPECGLKIPHIGWNSLRLCQTDRPILAGMPEEPYVYFVHSYACRAENREDVLTTTEYGTEFDSAVQRGNVMGMQFHPEKSGRVGEQLLRNFVRMSEGFGRN